MTMDGWLGVVIMSRVSPAAFARICSFTMLYGGFLGAGAAVFALYTLVYFFGMR